MGIETFNREAGKLVRKGMDPDQLKEGLLDFQSYTDTHAPRRYRANIQMICGIPGETVESWYDSMEWLNTYWTRQSASAWILEVSDYDESLTNQSRFTKELVKNGLKKLDSKEHPGYNVYKDEKGDIVFKSIQGGGVGTTRKDVVIWKHNDMDWFKAEALVKEFYSTEGYKGRKGGNPFLTDRLFRYYETSTYEDIYDKNISDIDTNDIKFKEFVQSYINKKLSWQK